MILLVRLNFGEFVINSERFTRLENSGSVYYLIAAPTLDEAFSVRYARTRAVKERGVYYEVRTPGGDIVGRDCLGYYDDIVSEEDILCAVRGHSVVGVQSWIDRGAELNSLAGRMPNTFTPLILACQYGYFDIVKLLVENGADVNIVGNAMYKTTALCEACRQGSEEICAYLLDHGAVVNHVDSGGWTPRRFAEHFGFTGIVSLLDSRAAPIPYPDTGTPSAIVQFPQPGPSPQPVSSESPGSSKPSVSSKPLAHWGKAALIAAAAAIAAAIAIPVIARAAKSPEAWLTDGITYAAEDNRFAARNAFDHAIKKRPDFTEAYKARAELNMRQDDYAAAAADWSEVIRLEPENADAYAARASMYDKLDESDKAVQDCRKVLELDAGHAAAKGLLVTNLRKTAALKEGQGDWAGAEKDYTDAITLEPDNVELYRGRAGARLNAGDGGIIEDYDNIIRLLPGDLQTLLDRAAYHMERKHYAEAAADYTSAVKLQEDNNDGQAGSSYWKRGAAYAAQGKYYSAIKDYNHACRVSGNMTAGQYEDFCRAVEKYGMYKYLYDPALTEGQCKILIGVRGTSMEDIRNNSMKGWTVTYTGFSGKRETSGFSTSYVSIPAGRQSLDLSDNVTVGMHQYLNDWIQRFDEGDVYRLTIEGMSVPSPAKITGYAFGAY